MITLKKLINYTHKNMYIINQYIMDTKTFTLTFGDRAENHKGMQIIGTQAIAGFTYDDLINVKTFFEKQRCKCKLIHLNKYVNCDTDDAYVLVIRKGVNALLEYNDADDMFNEHDKLPKDTKAFMYGRVVNKKARHNLCFSNESQEPDYENGKGRIISFDDVPLTNQIKEKFIEICKNKISELQIEGNYYYDVDKCGIGYHGDTERKIVIGIRLGATMRLCYVWYYQNKPISDILQITLNHGDIYFMSEKATGNDWKKSSIYTLRHAAGSDKYVNL